MRTAGIEGVRRTKRVRTTKPDPDMPRHPDLVGRDFTATAPNQLWVTDLTYVPTWAGVAYVCFIVDVYSRMIVGWRVASQLGYGTESVRSWVRQADVDEGHVPGVSTSDVAKMKALEQENRELKRANEILKRAASFFGAELDRQHKK